MIRVKFLKKFNLKKKSKLNNPVDKKIQTIKIQLTKILVKNQSCKFKYH